MRQPPRLSPRPAPAPGTATAARIRLRTALARDRATLARDLPHRPAEPAQPDLLDLLLAQSPTTSGGRA